MVNSGVVNAVDNCATMVNFFLPTTLFAASPRLGRAALPIIKVNGAMMRGMDIGSIPLFEAISRRLSWLTQRQTVLAENVANANTPGYIAKDLKQPDFGALLQSAASGVHLVTDHPGQLTHGPGGSIQTVSDKPNEVTINGNGVSIENQMLNVSMNAADYALTTTLYQDNIGLIKTVLGNGGGGG